MIKKLLGLVLMAVSLAAAGQGASSVTHTSTTVSVLITNTALLVANPSRRYLQIQNQDATNPIWVRCDGVAATADGNAVKIAAGLTWIPLGVPIGACAGISTGGTVITNITHGQ